MSDKRTPTLQWVDDEARADFYCAISDDLDFVKSQLARLPTRGQLAKAALGIIVATASLVIVGMEMLSR